MADFNTHFLTGTAVGAIYATVSTKGLVLDTQTAVLLAGMTAVGGVLPDIDLKDSTPSRALFLVLGAVSALLVMMHHALHFSVLELLAIGCAVFVTVRYILRALFHTLTVHRGSLHSLAASAMFGLCAVVFCHLGFDADAILSWLAGFGVLLGSLTHLVLDEIYSVDFTGARVKRSFGSALKVIDTVRWAGSLAVVTVTVLCLYLAPPAEPLLKALQAVDTDWKVWMLEFDF